MKKYFSWKINDTDYAYLYIPGKKTHINQRITDVDILNKIIAKVSKWDEIKFKEAFDSMNLEVNSQYGVSIPYTEKYFNGNQDENVIVMGASISEKEKYDNLKNELLDTIDQRFKEIKDYLDNFVKEMVKLSNKRTIDTINASKEVYNNTVEELQKVKTEVEERFGKANTNLEKAVQIIGLGNKGINADTIKQLFIQTHSNDESIKKINNNVDIVKTNYEALNEKHENLSKNFRDIETNVDRKVKDFKDVISRDTNDKIEKILVKANDYSDKVVNRARIDLDESLNAAKAEMMKTNLNK